jgi:hypothetical protein
MTTESALKDPSFVYFMTNTIKCGPSCLCGPFKPVPATQSITKKKGKQEEIVPFHKYK